MNNYLSIITRRSIRLFTEENVTEEQINKILDAGLAAPSSKNSNPWYFVALKESAKEKLLKSLKLSKEEKENLPIDPITGKPITAVKDTTFASLNIVKSAPLLILIFNTCPYSKGEKYVIEKNNIDIFHDYVIEMIGVGAAIENMLLAAHTLGLGGVCLRDLNIFTKEIKEFYKIDYDFIGALSIGHPAHSPGLRELQRNLVKIVE